MHININESSDIFSKILMIENGVDTNKESEKIELTISKKDYHLKLTHEKLDKTIMNEIANSNEKDVDYNQELKILF